MLYYLFSFSAGITVIRRHIGFTLNNVWLEYPQLYYTWDFKVFYLAQCSFYVMSVIVLFIEVHALIIDSHAEASKGHVGDALRRHPFLPPS